jgi:DNA-binding transcriptional MocR family regulator
VDFLDDDYDAINAEFFEGIRLGTGFLDPSGWLDTVSNALPLLPSHQINPNGLQAYYGDLSSNLGASKGKLSALLSVWDECSYSMDELTVCQSATAASFLTLAFLKSKGIRTVLFESPCYYASIEQCESLGLFSRRIVTRTADDFLLTLSEDFLDGASPCALWLTQPRIALGFNQDVEHVSALLDAMPANSL